MTTRWLSSKWLLIFLLAVCIARLWLMPLPASFWTDETGTAFIVQHPADPSLAAVPQTTASLYYVFPRLAGRLFGWSEVSYRLPSVLFLGIALFLVGRLAARLIDSEAAWFAVFACLALYDFNYFAADARPYALGICVAAASLYFLIAWLDTARWGPAFWFVLFAALLWRVHLVFWAFYPVFPIYAVARLARSTTKVGWIRALAVGVALALALIPTAFDALTILRNGKAHVIVPIPGVSALWRTIPWELVALCAGLAWLCAQYFKWRFHRPAYSGIALIACWWLWMPLCLFAFSRVTGTSLYVARYFSVALPGAALAATAAAAFYLPRARWKQASAVLAIAGLITAGRWQFTWPPHDREDWRQASLNEDLAAPEPDTPVVAVSPFIEAQPPAWSPEYRLPGFLYSPLFVYPLRGRIYPFPIARSPDAERYAANLLSGALRNRSRFIVYGGARVVRPWVLWFSGRPELANWRVSVDFAQTVETVVFENPAPATFR